MKVGQKKKKNTQNFFYVSRSRTEKIHLYSLRKENTTASDSNPDFFDSKMGSVI